ncbi:hypothetical protein ACFL08_02285 [Patescibacteria group bacterium]
MDIFRIRLSIGVFLIVAFLGFTLSTFAQDDKSNKSIFNDADQDGLSDEEEGVYGTDPNKSDSDGDGYSDGTEISSGYDPLKPAPGDRIVKDDENRSGELEGVELSENDTVNNTTALAEKIMAVMNSGDGGSTSLTTGDIDDLVADFMVDDASFDDLPEVDEDRIKIKDQDYDDFSEEKQERKRREDDEEYIVALAYLAVENSPYKITDPSDLDGFEDEIVSKIGGMANFSDIAANIGYFKGIAEKGQNFMDQIDSIEVPESMIPLHKRGIQLMTKAVLLGDEVKIDITDPIKSLMHVSKIQKILLLSMDFYEEVSDELDRLNITEIELEI